MSWPSRPPCRCTGDASRHPSAACPRRGAVALSSGPTPASFPALWAAAFRVHKTDAFHISPGRVSMLPWAAMPLWQRPGSPVGTTRWPASCRSTRFLAWIPAAPRRLAARAVRSPALGYAPAEHFAGSSWDDGRAPAFDKGPRLWSDGPIAGAAMLCCAPAEI